MGAQRETQRERERERERERRKVGCLTRYWTKPKTCLQPITGGFIAFPKGASTVIHRTASTAAAGNNLYCANSTLGEFPTQQPDWVHIYAAGNNLYCANSTLGEFPTQQPASDGLQNTP